MKITTGLAVAIVIIPLASRADDTGVDTTVAYGALGLAGAVFDIGFTVYDLSHFASGEPVPKAAGLIETLGALPQVAIAGYVVANPPPADGARALSVVWLVWATALAAHGIWTLARPVEPTSRIEIGVRPVEARRAFDNSVFWAAASEF